MAWEENSRICLHMQLIAILSRIGVVIADGVEAAGLMTGFQLFNCEVLVHSRGAAMHHNQIDVSHDIRFLPFYPFTFLPFKGSDRS